MEKVSLIVGLLIGLIVGVAAGYLAVSPQLSASEEISKLQTEVSTLQSELEAKTGELDRLRGEVSKLQTELEGKATEISKLKMRIEELEAMVPPPPPKEGEPGYSRFFPAPIGSNLTAKFEWFRETYIACITLKQVIRGEEAWKMIQEANPFNRPPKEGYEYILAKIHFLYVSGPTAETAFEVSGILFDAVSEDGRVYDDVLFVVVPEPSLDEKLYPGASHEGWVVFEVEKTDLKPLMSFATDPLTGTGGIWFKLYEEE